LIGAINGEATSVAIIELPSGSKLISGAATKEYISDANGIPTITKIPNKIITFSNLVLSSSK
jgi:hypothetical protein